MVADIERKEVYRNVRGPVHHRGPEESMLVIGRETIVIEQDMDDNTFLLSVYTEKSDFDEPSSVQTRITYPMLHAMMVAHGQYTLRKGIEAAKRQGHASLAASMEAVGDKVMTLVNRVKPEPIRTTIEKLRDLDDLRKNGDY